MITNDRNMSHIEYLILNEDTLNWDELSANKDELTGIIEVRLFRKRINWYKYILNHINTITPEILEIGSKHFSKSIFELAALLEVTDEAFLRNHIEMFNFENLIKNNKLSSEFLLEFQDKWKDIPNIYSIFKTAKHIDINSKEMNPVRLILELKDK